MKPEDYPYEYDLEICEESGDFGPDYWDEDDEETLDEDE